MGKDQGLLDYSKVFYAASALFAVLAVLYFGFEYIQNLSPATISLIIFAIFATTFLKGTETNNRGVKLLYYLLSTGSYLVFIIYINARLIDTDNGVLASLILSAIIFAAIGHLVTKRQDLIPNQKQIKKITIATAILLTLITLYDGAATGYEHEYQLEEQVQFQENQETLIGQIQTSKHGYLPLDVERQRATYCTTNGTVNMGLGGTSYGGYQTTFAPETRTENLTVQNRHRLEEIDLDLSNETLEVVEVDSCGRNELDIQRGQLGVELNPHNIRLSQLN